MDEREELREELEQELQWVKYRQKMLDNIEEKLLQMKELAQQAKDDNLSAEELATINTKINRLAVQVNALDEESRIIELEGIGE